MSYPFFIARRYLQFQRKNNGNFVSFLTVIAVLGVMLGVTALLITLTILSGFEKEITEKVIGFTTHIQVTGFSNQPLTEYEQAREKILHIQNIQNVSPFIAKEGMVKFHNNIEGIIVKGIDYKTDVSSVQKYLIQGTYSLDKKSKFYYCIIGKNLSLRLNAHLYDTVIVFGLRGTYSEFQPPRIMPFIVSGIYESGMAEFDDVYFFTDIQTAQELFLLEGVTGFDVLLNDIIQAPTTAQAIMNTMGYPYYARTLFQLYRNLFTWLNLQKEPIPIILGLIIIVATVNIIGTLLMMVLEKKRQIGIFIAMGATRSAIKKIFLYQGIAIGMIGTVLGNILAITLCFLQIQFHFFSLPSSIYFMTSVPILFRWENFVIVSCIAIILCAVASFIPSTLASRLEPIRSIRFY